MMEASTELGFLTISAVPIRMATIIIVAIGVLTFAFDINGTDISRSFGKRADLSFFLFKIRHQI